MDHEASKSRKSESAPETKGRTIRYWARFYDAFSWVVSLGRWPAIRKTTVELAQVAPGQKVLDVGCGTGSLAIDAKAKVGSVGEVHGIDAAPEMIEVARQKADRKGVDAGFEVGLIEDIPFPDGQFDLVLNSFVLHHLPHDLKRKGFAEIRRVLKPGGRFLVTDLAPPGDSVIGRVMAVLIGHARMHTDVGELTAMMEEAGFAEVEEVKTKYKQVLFVHGKADSPAGTSEV